MQKYADWQVMVQQAVSCSDAGFPNSQPVILSAARRGDCASLPEERHVAPDVDLGCHSVHNDAFKNTSEAFTLSIPSAREHRDSFPGPRQVLKKDLLAVWLRHFHSTLVYNTVEFK